MSIRNYINIIESTSAIHNLRSSREVLILDLMKNMDERSVAAILEMDYDTDSEELASAWFDSCLALYEQASQTQQVRIYRHMMVEDFNEFIISLKDGSGKVGEYWSFDYSIESPTWKENQKGNIPVSLQGHVSKSQIDWKATLMQNFEWPHEWEVIFTGDVFVIQIENQDNNKVRQINKLCKRR